MAITQALVIRERERTTFKISLFYPGLQDIRRLLPELEHSIFPHKEKK